MKKVTGGLIFVLGLALGLALAYVQHGQAQTPTPVRPPLQFLVYPGGVTGIYDPAVGRLYFYDTNAQHCYAIRQLVKPGDSMVRIKS